MAGPPSKRYRQYLRNDEIAIPESTSRRWDKQSEGLQPAEVADVAQENDDDAGVPEVEVVPHMDNPHHQYDFHYRESDESDDGQLDETQPASNQSESEDEDSDDQSEDEDSDDHHLFDRDSDLDDNDDAGTDDNDPPQDHDDDQLDGPIYPGSDITVGQAVTLILCYILRHTATKCALRDVLQLIRTLLGPNEALPKSLYYFHKYFRHVRGVVEQHFYCSACENGIGQNPPEECQCGAKKKKTKRLSDGDFFIIIPMKGQIKKLLQRPEISENLQYRFTRAKKQQQNIEDIYDGQLYKECVEMNNPNNISILWNTDGVSVSKSSNYSIWPIQFVVNELPPKLRRKNVLMAGIWFGSKKPNMDIFFDCFVKECDDLRTNGLTYTNQDGSRVHTKVVTIACTCDSPARAMLMNQKQYNGFHGCSWCLHPGSRVEKGRGTVTVYPYEAHPSPMRSEQQTVIDAEQALLRGEAVHGVKGPSKIMLIKMDCIRGYSVDYLHADLSGVVKALLELWFDPPDKEQNYYIGRQLKEVDKRLLDIKPPNNFPRTPRRLSTRKNWKAKEFMFWLLHYSVPCLVGILPNVYFQHWILLVHGLSVFLSESISERQAGQCHLMLVKFVRDFQDLYGRENMTFNVHSLNHVVDCVRNLGPLWATSTFIFESNNGSLVRLAHGTQYIPLQIARNFTLRQHLPSLHMKHIRGTDMENLYGQIVSPYLPCINSLLVGNSARAFGKCSLRPPTPAEGLALETMLTDPVPNEIAFYNRVTVNGKMYHCQKHTRIRKRISYLVNFRDDSVGVIVQYCVIGEQAFAFYREARISRHARIGRDQETGACAEHINVIEQIVPELKAISVDSFREKCIFIRKENGIHARDLCIVLPNTIELD